MGRSFAFYSLGTEETKNENLDLGRKVETNLPQIHLALKFGAAVPPLTCKTRTHLPGQAWRLPGRVTWRQYNKCTMTDATVKSGDHYGKFYFPKNFYQVTFLVT